MTERERRHLREWWVADEESEALPAERIYGFSPSRLASQWLVLAAGLAVVMAAGALYF